MASKLQEKLDKRNTAITQGRAFVDKADTEKRAMTDDEKTLIAGRLMPI